MPNQINTAEALQNDDQKTKQLVTQERLDRSAEDASEQAARTEQRYDEGHQIFTK